MSRSMVVIAAVAAFLAPVPAVAAPSLTVSVSHAPSHFLPGMVAAYATITVSNPRGGTATGPVTITGALPPGLTAAADGRVRAPHAGEVTRCQGIPRIRRSGSS
jgi:hypothetical protein